MDLLLERLNTESAVTNPPSGLRSKRHDLQSVPSLPDSLDCSFSAFNMPASHQQAPGFERSASVSSVSTTSRINGTVPFAPQSANVQRGSAGAKRDFAAVKAGDDTPLKRAKEPAHNALSSRESGRASQDTLCLPGPWASHDQLRGGLRSRLQSEGNCSEAPSAVCSYTNPNVLDSSHSTDLCCGESDVFSDRKQYSAEWSAGPRQARDEAAGPQTLHSCTQTGPGWKPPYELLDTIRALFTAEDTSRPNPNYMHNHGRHLNPSLYIDAPMRTIAVSWLVEVACEYGLHQETLFLSTMLLDNFLATAKAVPRSKLQLVSVACMLIAAKQEEELHPSITDFTSIADHCFVEAELVQMESLVLQALKFRVCVPSSHTFLSIFLQMCQVSARTLSLATYLTELAMLEYSLLRHAPSVIAHSALILAAWTCNDTAGLQQTKHMADIGCQHSTECLQDLLDLHHGANAARDNNNPLMAVKDKYRDYPWHCVANIVALPVIPTQH
ncbi:hypothetical protein WJX74_003921 [Apatococcus lobatus]|uniref:Uncharacterized protein n=1 Tax=Apatococcus lobatus TaxID=904363 RepID=A0AAW1SFF7_9CHLO